MFFLVKSFLDKADSPIAELFMGIFIDYTKELEEYGLLTIPSTTEMADASTQTRIFQETTSSFSSTYNQCTKPHGVLTRKPCFLRPLPGYFCLVAILLMFNVLLSKNVPQEVNIKQGTVQTWTNQKYKT